MYHPNLFAGNSRSSATGLSEARPLCNYRTAWDFHLSAFLCSTAQPLGFRQLTKDNALPSLLLDYAVDGMIIHVRRQGWKEGERADFSVAQQACGECHLGFGKRHYPASVPGCTPASALLRSHPPDICLPRLCVPPGPISRCQLLRGRKSSVYLPSPWRASDLLWVVGNQ